MTAPTNALTYNLYVQQIIQMAVSDAPTLVAGVMTGNSDFQAIVPSMLDYAELRIQRDLDLLPLETEKSFTLSAGSNKLTLSVDDFVTVRTAAVAFGGQTYPLLPVTKEFIQNVYGSSSTATIPQYFAMYGGDAATTGATSNILLLGPWPDQNYPAVLTGTVRASR